MLSDHHHLTHSDGCLILTLRKNGLSQGAIARQPGRCPSVISREIRRNSGAGACHYSTVDSLSGPRLLKAL